jgi:hypothetical protein
VARKARCRPEATGRSICSQEARDGCYGAEGHRLVLRILQSKSRQGEGPDGQGGRGIPGQERGHNGRRHGLGADC